MHTIPRFVDNLRDSLKSVHIQSKEAWLILSPVFILTYAKFNDSVGLHQHSGLYLANNGQSDGDSVSLCPRDPDRFSRP